MNSSVGRCLASFDETGRYWNATDPGNVAFAECPEGYSGGLSFIIHEVIYTQGGGMLITCLSFSLYLFLYCVCRLNGPGTCKHFIVVGTTVHSFWTDLKYSLFPPHFSKEFLRDHRVQRCEFH